MKKTKSDDSRGNVEHDRVSSMPDEVLTHILSFLSTKEAVRTCILLKRWINTRATVLVLDFNLYDFLSDDLDGNPSGEREERKSVARFEQFVHGVLNIHESANLDVVCYTRPMQRSETFIPMKWLDRVALLMPRVINIYIGRVNATGDLCFLDYRKMLGLYTERGNYIDLPDSVFSSARLQHLKMGLYTNKRTIIRPASINLPLLKVLELGGVELPNDFTQKLFMGCPSLERLNLRCCDLYFSSISSNALKNLTISQCNQFEHMQISCLALVSLSYGSNFRRGGVGISLKKATNLVNATIRIFWRRQFSGGPVLDLFRSLSSATELTLCFDRDLMEPVEKDVSNCRNFRNLKNLHLEMWDMSSGLYLIACLLKSSPNLNKLSLLVNLLLGYIIEEPRRDILGEVFFQHEYLEDVSITIMGKFRLPSEHVENWIKTLRKYVKKIGNISIT